MRLLSFVYALVDEKGGRTSLTFYHRKIVYEKINKIFSFVRPHPVYRCFSTFLRPFSKSLSTIKMKPRSVLSYLCNVVSRTRAQVHYLYSAPATKRSLTYCTKIFCQGWWNGMQTVQYVLWMQKEIESEELGVYFFQLDNSVGVSNQYRCLFSAFRQSDHFLCNIPGSIGACQRLDVLRQA